MRDFTIVFMHGYTSSHLADWYPQIAQELDAIGIHYVIPDLPGGSNPYAKEWLETLHTAISHIDTSLVLVGHSLGTRAALLYLEKYHTQIIKVFLIAAFANTLHNAKRKDKEGYATFFDHVIDLDKIKPLVEKFIVMHSKDDDSIPYQQGEEIAKDLNATLITYNDRKHFSGSRNAPVILEELRKELSF